MPTTFQTSSGWQVPRFPKWTVILVPIGFLLMGWGVGNDYLAAKPPGVAGGVVTKYGTHLVVSTETVTQKVRGKVVTRDQDVYIKVPVTFIRIDHRVVKVPEHLLPLRSASAMVATPLVTVTAYVPTTVTVAVPTTVTSTATVTSTDLVPTTVTTTITLPLDSGGPVS